MVERRAGVPVEGFLIHPYQAEMPGESIRPFPAIEQRRVEIAEDVAAAGHGVGDGGQMTVQVGDPLDIGSRLGVADRRVTGIIDIPLRATVRSHVQRRQRRIVGSEIDQ